MNDILTDKEIERIKRKYSVGTRLECINMDDPFHPIPSGVRGTVERIDDGGKKIVIGIMDVG